MHAFNQRILAEDLVRIRRPDERERYAATQRQARIDPNPHQIDAAIFALRRLREGGCILADEVGLGKTIEAGLVIAQRQAEGAHLVRGFLRSTPVLLLTATPMQNSLVELWGLVQYVEPTGTLLGDIATFRKVFCSDDDRTLIPGQEYELKRRLTTDAAPAGSGVPRQAVHAAAMPVVRLRDE